jgi:hypothetical protein
LHSVTSPTRTWGADSKQAGTAENGEHNATKSGDHPDGKRAQTSAQESPISMRRSASPSALNADFRGGEID